MSRTTRVLVASGLVVAPMLWAPAAHADDDRLGISLDGVTFTDTIQQPLFDQDLRWVPGDVLVSTFYVRNESTDGGDLAVRVSRNETADQLLTSGALQIDARAAGQSWQAVSAGSERGVMELEDIPSGTTVPVQVRARMLASSPNDTMQIAADLRLAVRLTDATAILGEGEAVAENGIGEGGSVTGTVSVPGTAGNDFSGAEIEGRGEGFLPETGYGLPPGLAWLGLALCGTGAFLITRRRREDRMEVRHG